MISFTKDNQYQSFCKVAVILRTWNKFIRFSITSTHPIAVFSKSKRKTISFICINDDVHIRIMLKETAKVVHNIISKEELARFTARSIRLGVCVMIRTNGFFTSMIQVQLCLRSDAFKFYLCNIESLAGNFRDFFYKA